MNPACLGISFFDRATLTVAKELIGKRLHYGGKSGIITETEAYIGQDDPACHAAHGPTPRNIVMFGRAGHAYVYFIYGMYYCLNFVTESEGFAAAVLIRWVYDPESNIHYDGPWKLCRYFGITTKDNKADICASEEFFVEDDGITLIFCQTPRIGIRVWTDKLFRFVATDISAMRP